MKQLLFRIWYELISFLIKDAEFLFMNYGYAADKKQYFNLPQTYEDGIKRYSAQLYFLVTEAVDLTGLSVLEIGCGRGGGASLVQKYLRPESVVGIDSSARAVEFCNQYYKRKNLRFFRGDAQNLQFDSETFDAVINVESSHLYSSFEEFLAEVHRVLKPNGHFLFADWRETKELPLFITALASSGFTILHKEDITEGVVRAMIADSDRKKDLIEKYCPPFLMKPFLEFAGIVGTDSNFGALKNHQRTYLRYALRKI